MDVRLRLREEHLDPRLPLLGFRDDDLFDLLTRIPAVGSDPADVARLNQLAAELVDHLDAPGQVFTKDDAEHPLGQGLLPLLALLATADDVVRWLRGREVPDEIVWRSLSDLGQQVWVHRLTFGQFGLHTQGWLQTAWSGRLFWLGRLQHELVLADGEWVDSLHIPQSGPLTAQVVDDSLAQAEGFFARHFPDRLPVRRQCASWLLDPELADAMPGSNIAAFAERFELTGEGWDGDADAVFFTWRHRGPYELDRLPRRTRLERVVAERLAAGGHWRVCTGILSPHG
ncbi:DUF5596 domain-containing protein [Naumannella sp. ID2617S]|nr:DUF5596 domain-containing protein [Naumannella sp. ID2617S]